MTHQERLEAIRARREAAPGPLKARYLNLHPVPSNTLVRKDDPDPKHPLPIVDVWLPLPWRGAGGKQEERGRQAEREAYALTMLLLYAPDDLAWLDARLGEALELLRREDVVKAAAYAVTLGEIAMSDWLKLHIALHDDRRAFLSQFDTQEGQ